jgi:hypothetical protein
MSINCSSNPKLEALEKKKKELADQAASLASAGSGAMADLKAKANSMKDALLDMIPEIPAIPNFAQEIQDLAGKIGQELVDAKAAFKERWGDSLPDVDIDNLMDGVSNPLNTDFDLCKDVPNVDAPEVVDGKVTKVKDKGPAPTTATEVPKVVEVVEPTVVEKEKAPTINPALEKSKRDIQDQIDAFNKDLQDTYTRYVKASKEISDKMAVYEQEPVWGEIKQVQTDREYQAGFYDVKYANLYPDIPQAHFDFIKKYYTDYYREKSLRLILRNLRAIQSFSINFGIEPETQFDEYVKLRENEIEENYVELIPQPNNRLAIRESRGSGLVVVPFAQKFKDNKQVMDDLYAARNAAKREAGAGT